MQQPVQGDPAQQATVVGHWGDWQVCEDGQGQFYHHMPTGSTQDEPPPELAQAMADGALQPPAPADAGTGQPAQAQAGAVREVIGEWQVCEDAQGIFYHNTTTGQSYDQAPPELVPHLQHPPGAAQTQPADVAPGAQPEQQQPEQAQQAQIREQIGDWQVCEDAQGIFYHHMPTGQSYDQPPPELAQLQHAAGATAPVQAAQPVVAAHHVMASTVQPQVQPQMHEQPPQIVQAATAEQPEMTHEFGGGATVPAHHTMAATSVVAQPPAHEHVQAAQLVAAQPIVPTHQVMAAPAVSQPLVQQHVQPAQNMVPAHHLMAAPTVVSQPTVQQHVQSAQPVIPAHHVMAAPSVVSHPMVQQHFQSAQPSAQPVTSAGPVESQPTYMQHSPHSYMMPQNTASYSMQPPYQYQPTTMQTSQPVQVPQQQQPGPGAMHSAAVMKPAVMQQQPAPQQAPAQPSLSKPMPYQMSMPMQQPTSQVPMYHGGVQPMMAQPQYHQPHVQMPQFVTQTPQVSMPAQSFPGYGQQQPPVHSYIR